MSYLHNIGMPAACWQHTCTPSWQRHSCAGGCLCRATSDTCHSQQQVNAAELHNNQCKLQQRRCRWCGLPHHLAARCDLHSTAVTNNHSHTQQHCTIDVQLPAQALHACAWVHTGTLDNVNFVCCWQASCKQGAHQHMARSNAPRQGLPDPPACCAVQLCCAAVLCNGTRAAPWVAVLGMIHHASGIWQSWCPKDQSWQERSSIVIAHHLPHSMACSMSPPRCLRWAL